MKKARNRYTLECIEIAKGQLVGLSQYSAGGDGVDHEAAIDVGDAEPQHILGIIVFIGAGR